ncbi:MAG: hypothetical protein FJY07_03070 [Bacteroidetes bacterium]|nr:hypothetical protein [Bacteroidota bacterium]
MNLKCLFKQKTGKNKNGIPGYATKARKHKNSLNFEYLKPIQVISVCRLVYYAVLAVLIVSISDPAMGQEALLYKTISLKVTDQPLEKVLEKITGQTGINFSYNSRIITGINITADLNLKPLGVVLDSILQPHKLEFEVVGDQVVIKKIKQKASAEKTFTVSGFIRDSETGESLPGATVMIAQAGTGTISNSYGFYSLTLPTGDYTLLYSFIGFREQKSDIRLEKDITLNTNMIFNTRQLGEVIITTGDKLESIEKSQTSRILVNPKNLVYMPEFAGEVGLNRCLQTLPGIKTHSDGSSFFFVRGGNKDQNLILIDEAPVFNPSHLFGYYSVIIPEVAKSISIYKADMPVEKDSRISSLIDIQTKDGNMNKYEVDGMLNPLIYRISLEGPIKKEKASVYTSFRHSNFRWLYRQAAPNSDLYLYDFNGKLNFMINPNNRIFYSIYFGKDNFTNTVNNETGGIRWTNLASTVRWNHIFNRRLFTNLTVFGSSYNYTLLSKVKWLSEISSFNFNYDFTYYRKPQLTLKFGLNQSMYNFNPGNLELEDAGFVFPVVSRSKSSLTALYFSREQSLTKKLSYTAGIRLSLWSDQGPSTIYSYDSNYLVTDTVTYGEGKSYKTYVNLDPRVSIKYLFDSTLSAKASFGIYHQYLNLLSNSISPFTSFELWLPAGPNIRPQRSDQAALGLVKYFRKVNLEFTAEAYYKAMRNQIDYEPHANLILNPLIEGELRFGTAKAYGIEFLVRRIKGRLSGWVSYTYSKVRMKIEGVNYNREYPPFYDRPHDLSLFLSYNFTRKINLSANWIYYTGSAITTPVGFYEFNGSAVPLYGDKNNDRLPDYHRLDLALTWTINKPERKFQHSLAFGIYNFYNRHNPVSFNFNKIEDGNKFYVPANLYGTAEIVTTQTYLLGIMPSITYKFKI